MIRVEGLADSVAYRCGELQKLLADIGDFTVERDPERTAAGWRYIRDVAPFHGRAGEVWRLSVTPSQAPEIVARLDGAEAVYDWGGGLVWVLVPDGTPVRAALTGGHATLFRASAARRAEAGVFQPQPAPLAALEAGLRAKFDPKGILNPGLMG